jgi:integrase/recombinase XerD
MFYLGENTGSKARVNVLKKVKVNGAWRLCSAVVEANGKLQNKVHVDGRIEVHAEGVYYIEWREENQRRRQSVPNRGDVLEKARLKALEIDTKRAHIDAAPLSQSISTAPAATDPSRSNSKAFDKGGIGNALGVILQGVQSYLEEIVGVAVESRLSKLGLSTMAPLASSQEASPPEAFQPLPAPPPTSQNQAPTPATQHNNGKLPIDQTIAAYLKDMEPPQRERKTYDEYRLVLNKFRDTCGKRYLQEISRDDCLAFMRHLYSVGNEARTVFNRMGIVQQLLKLHGITGLLLSRDKPKWVANVRKMYEPEDLEALFKACTPDERLLYLFFLLTGERDKEVRYTSWADVDFARKCVRVTAKKQLGFKPKDKEEREIPVPSSLLDALKVYKARQQTTNPHNLVFPTSQGRPDKNFQNKLKRIVHRFGLNCGHCHSKHGNKCAEGAHCGKWFLHKFRHTFATASLESGVSIRTLQEWLGHSDLASTMVYLKFVGRKDIHKLLDSSQMADLATQSLRLGTVASHAAAHA